VEGLMMENTDAQELRKFGYAQQLRRSMGAFSSFAVAFSLISVLTGVFANFGHGLRQVGGAVVWSWLIVVTGQLLVALVLAELSTRIPLSGYGYQWASRLVNPHFGFSVGWLLTLQFVTGFPGVCATLASQAGNWLGGRWAEPRMVVALTLGVIALVTLVHLAGIRLASLMNDAGVWTELAGVATLSVVLIVVALGRDTAPALLLQAQNAATGTPPGWSAWALSLLLGAWCLTGFEAAADFAEETHQPRRLVPRAMLLSLLGAGGAGFLLLAGAVWCIQDLPATPNVEPSAK
jgi:amino acid transporter